MSGGIKMIKSMTGYGRGEIKTQDYHILVELKSVNHKYNDFTFRMPKYFAFAEDKMRKAIRQKLHRGKVDVMMTVDNLSDKEFEVRVNTKLAKEYIEKIGTMCEACDIKEGPGIDLITKLPDVITAMPLEANQEELLSAIIEATQDATKQLDDMRIKEGRVLAEDLNLRAANLKKIVQEMVPLAEETPEIYREKLSERINKLLEKNGIGDTYLSEERLATEVAIFADKVNVDEELTRLKSHILQITNLTTTGSSADGSVGKKLDFLAQELNREANTIGSKSNNLELTNLVLKAKAEIEKIREQVQNIE